MVFLVVYFFSGSLIKNYVIDKEANHLYSEATTISSSYASDYYKKNSSITELHEQIQVISSYIDGDIYVISTTGKIIADSSMEGLPDSSDVIENFDPTITNGKFYQIGTFYNCFNNDTLSVIAPVTINYKVRGYITLHKSLSSILKDVDKLINIVYFSLFLVYLCGLFVLIVLILNLYLPIRKMTKVAKEYASGNFEPQIRISDNGELGFLAASFNFMANELNTLEDDQRKFISNISHDFRSPLTSIKGYIEAIEDGTIPPEMQQKYLDIVLFETDRLTKLTGNLLDLNKIGTKGSIMDITDFDLNLIIKNTAASFEGTGKEKRISIDLVLTGQSMYVTADMSKIQQVLYNLIDNAIKFSHPDSTIKIETTERNEKIFVSIKDSGIGIPKNSINKIWERFYKTDLSRGKDKKGTGLGLAIVKEIIQSHNENINVISTEGVGTEFIFTLAKAK